MGFLADLLQNVSNGASNIGIKTPELGWTESLGGASVAPNHAQDAALNFTKPTPTAPAPVSGVLGTNTIANQLSSNAVSGGGSGGTSASAADIAYLDNQAQQLRDLLARTDTGLNQGLTQNQDEYDRQLGGANASKALQYANYEDQRVAQNQGKLNTYETINKNANNGYRSLAQIIGRAAGTASSAFRESLPSVIGSDTSTKRSTANQTYGSNLQGIDKAQGQYDISFADVLDDLLRQKKTNESTLRSGIEGQRQTLNSQLGTVEGQKVQARGGGAAQIRAAQQPFQDSINNSRNQVESFFNQFRTAYTPKAAVAATPELAGYTADRSVINAQNQGVVDASNPYAALLRKKQAGTV